MARVSPLDIVEMMVDPPRNAAHQLAAGCAIYLPLAGMVDLDAERSARRAS